MEPTLLIGRTSERCSQVFASVDPGPGFPNWAVREQLEVNKCRKYVQVALSHYHLYINIVNSSAASGAPSV